MDHPALTNIAPQPWTTDWTVLPAMEKEVGHGRRDTSELEFVAFGGTHSFKDLIWSQDRSFPENTHVCVQLAVLRRSPTTQSRLVLPSFWGARKAQGGQSMTEERMGDTATVSLHQGEPLTPVT